MRNTTVLRFPVGWIGSTGEDMTHWKTIIILILALFTAGCSSKKLPLLPLKMMVEVRPDSSANNGESFWMVVKEVDENEFADDTYQAIESIVTADTWGPDVLMVCAVVPGRRQRVTMIKPTYRGAGFYFLFTNPQEYWKVFKKQPIGTKSVLTIEQYKAHIAPLGSTF